MYVTYIPLFTLSPHCSMNSIVHYRAVYSARNNKWHFQSGVRLVKP